MWILAQISNPKEGDGRGRDRVNRDLASKDQKKVEFLIASNKTQGSRWQS